VRLVALALALAGCAHADLDPDLVDVRRADLVATVDVEGELAATGWFAGSALTIADIQMSFPLEAAAARGGMGERFPLIRAFLERIHARPAYKTAIEKGGPYVYAK